MVYFIFPKTLFCIRIAAAAAHGIKARHCHNNSKIQFFPHFLWLCKKEVKNINKEKKKKKKRAISIIPLSHHQFSVRNAFIPYSFILFPLVNTVDTLASVPY